MPTDDPSVAGFTKIGKRNFFLISRSTLQAIAFPFPAVNGEKRNDGQAGLLEKALLNVFVHPDCRGENACADVGKSCEVEETLHGAVFSKCAMEDGEDHVDHYAWLASGSADGNELRSRGIGGQHDAVTGFQDVAQHFHGA